MIKLNIFNTPSNCNVKYILKSNSDTIIDETEFFQQDINFHDLPPNKYSISILSESSLIYQLEFEILPQWYQTFLFKITMLLLVVTCIVLIVYYASTIKIKSKLQKEKIRHKILALESTSKLNQLKPHFIFNLIGPLQQYFVENNQEKGLNYLYNFSALLRKMISISRNNTISLEKEIEFLNSYLQLQHHEKFNLFEYKIECSTINISSNIKIPNLLIQPIIENTINYGFKNNQNTKGTIQIIFTEIENFIEVKIIENGIGFDILKLKNKQDNALNIITERLAIMSPQGKISFIKSETNFTIILKIPIHL